MNLNWWLVYIIGWRAGNSTCCWKHVLSYIWICKKQSREKVCFYIQNHESRWFEWPNKTHSGGYVQQFKNPENRNFSDGECSEILMIGCHFIVAAYFSLYKQLSVKYKPVVECIWNVMAHAQKPDFGFRRNGWVHLNRLGRQFSQLLAAKVCASAFNVGSNAGYTMFWGSVKSTGSPSLPLPCVTVCHHVSTGL